LRSRPGVQVARSIVPASATRSDQASRTCHFSGESQPTVSVLQQILRGLGGRIIRRGDRPQGRGACQFERRNKVTQCEIADESRTSPLRPLVVRLDDRRTRSINFASAGSRHDHLRSRDRQDVLQGVTPCQPRRSVKVSSAHG
jgi:hypothetical protein